MNNQSTSTYTKLPTVIVTTQDRERISSALEAAMDERPDELERLDQELSRAEVVPPREVPPDVVTMNSRVVYEDEVTGVVREITLVYPQDANASEARISVLSPVGSALIGMRVGQVIEWTVPKAGRKRYRVLSVPYQPEAAGDFHL